MKRLLLLACLLAFPLYAQHHLGPGPAGMGAGEGTAGGPTFPSGVLHAWKMEEATGATRLNSAGSGNMAEAGTGDVSRVTGKSGYAASSPGGANGPYLTTTSALAISGNFTISVWAASPSSTTYAIGPQGGPPGIVTVDTTGNVSFEIWDPTTADDSRASGDAGTPTAWMLLVGRFNQTLHTFNLRAYGLGTTKQYEGVAVSGPWLNSFTGLLLEPFHLTGITATTGTVDELYVFGGILTDEQCDALCDWDRLRLPIRLQRRLLSLPDLLLRDRWRRLR